jgi:hypothetical protein
LPAMPGKRGAGRGSGSPGSAGRGSPGPGDVLVAPALEAGANPAVPDKTDKYTDAIPREAVVAVNEVHMIKVNEALAAVEEALPGGAGKES